MYASEHTTQREFRRFLLVASSLCVVLLVFTLGVNLLVNPLWYGAGNRVAPVNYAFNERLSKINLYLQQAGRYDCLILGSSRTTLLDEKDVSGSSCFNLSFSGGRVEEYVAYLEYLLWTGWKPRLVIVGVDDFGFQAFTDLDRIPAYITGKQAPPSLLASYLSYDALAFSLRSLFGESPLPRIYRADFSAAFIRESMSFKPTSIFGTPRAGAYLPEKNLLYQRLTRLLPDARWVGYVPPISAWHIEQMRRSGHLSSYLEAMHLSSRWFSEFHDFSLPSATTIRTDNSYDGSHYDPPTNRAIVGAMLGRGTGDGLRVDGLTLEGYVARYERAMCELARPIAEGLGESPPTAVRCH